MAVADRYGWHRDELYYLAASRHLALGYVDYPPITPLLARVDQAILPGSLPGLRLLTVLAGAAIIIIAALIARELGGNGLAQSLTGLAVLISPMFIGTNILFQTVSFDELVWVVAYWLQQLLLAGPQLVPIVVIGVVWLWRNPRFRAAAVSIIAVELLFFLAGGKAYYPAPIYPLAYAAGCVWFVEAVRRRWVRRVAVFGAVALTVLLLPLGLPVLPAQVMADSGVWK